MAVFVSSGVGVLLAGEEVAAGEGVVVVGALCSAVGALVLDPAPVALGEVDGAAAGVDVVRVWLPVCGRFVLAAFGAVRRRFVPAIFACDV